MYQLSHKSFIIFLLVILVSCHTAKQTTKPSLPGNWPARPIVVDGYNRDWPSPYPFTDDKSMISYAMSNDASNLYITVETNDPKTQLKILDAGMTIWIDTSGAQAMKTGINYPAANENAAIPMNRLAGEHNGVETDRGARMQMRVKNSLADAQKVSFTGFPECNTSFNVVDENACNIKVRMAIDSTSNNMVWEASVPFKVLLGKDKIDKKDEGRALSVGFNIYNFKMPAKFKQAEEKIKNDTTGRMNERFAEMKPLFEPTITWKQFGLAYQH